MYIDVISKLYCFTREFGRILVIISFLYHMGDALAVLFDWFSCFTGSTVLDLIKQLLGLFNRFRS